MNPLETIVRAQAKLEQSAPKLNKLKEACEQMEAGFMKTLVHCMRQGIQETHFGEAPGGDIYSDMYDQAVADSMAKGGTIGISKLIFQPLAAQVLAQTRPGDTAATSQGDNH